MSGLEDLRREEQAGRLSGDQVSTLIQGPQWGPVGGSGLGGLNMEGSEGFQVLPSRWEPSHQAPSPCSHASLHWVLTALRSGAYVLHQSC